MKTINERIADIKEFADKLKNVENYKDNLIVYKGIYDKGCVAKQALEIIQELQSQLEEMTKCRDNALEKPFELAKKIVELREELEACNELRQASFAVNENLRKENEELKQKQAELATQLVQAWDKDYNRNLKDEQRCKKIDELILRWLSEYY